MSRATEKLLDLLLGPSQWEWTMPSSTSISYKKIVNATEEMLIEPDTEHGPVLRIMSKDEHGVVLHERRFNLAAVDEQIGKLIQMRDAMAKLKGTTE